MNFGISFHLFPSLYFPSLDYNRERNTPDDENYLIPGPGEEKKERKQNA